MVILVSVQGQSDVHLFLYLHVLCIIVLILNIPCSGLVQRHMLYSIILYAIII